MTLKPKRSVDDFLRGDLCRIHTMRLFQLLSRPTQLSCDVTGRYKVPVR